MPFTASNLHYVLKLRHEMVQNSTFLSFFKLIGCFLSEIGAVFIIVQTFFALGIGQNRSDIPQFQQGHVRSRLNAFDKSGASESI